MAVLELPSLAWQFPRTTAITSKPVILGDNYEMSGNAPNSDRQTYEVISPDITTAEKDDLLELFAEYQGYEYFQWRPFTSFSYLNFTCQAPRVENIGVGLWRVSATFEEYR